MQWYSGWRNGNPQCSSSSSTYLIREALARNQGPSRYLIREALARNQGPSRYLIRGSPVRRELRSHGEHALELH